jgi:putative membrane protein
MSRLLLGLTLALCAAAALATAQIASGHSHHARHHHHHVSAWDKEWLMMSIEGDRFEIAGGMLAQSKGVNPKVRALGARLVTDHSKSLSDAIKLAHKFGIQVPKTPSPSQEWELKTVGRFSGAAFDKSYSDLEVQDHIQDIQEAKDEVDMGTNRQIRKDAKSEIPTLKEHLRLAREALAAVGGNG